MSEIEFNSLKQVGKGGFSRCYELNSDTVLLESFDPIKEIMANGLFPESRYFPKIHHYHKKNISIGGAFYTMHYYKGRPNRSTQGWLRDNLETKEFETYMSLFRLTEEVGLFLKENKGNKKIDVEEQFKSAFLSLKDKKLGKILFDAYSVCCDSLDRVLFDCYPKNVACENKKLILLDCFYSSKEFYRIKFQDKIEWAIEWKTDSVKEIRRDKVRSKSVKKEKTNKSINDFKPAKYNPRKISALQLKALDKSIQEFGDLSVVVINAKTQTIVAGHQRLKTIKERKTKIVTKPHKDKHGTVEIGYIVVFDENSNFRIPIRIVDWDKRREKLANIAANSHGGEFDNQKLGKLLAELDNEQFDIELTGFSDGEFQNLIRKAQGEKPEDRYIRNLSSPIYKIRGSKPKISKIYDTTKTEELKASILEAGLPNQIKDFLMCAAERHTKFHFDAIAEFYAHSSPKVQRLMEDCALVIIDHKKAIEHGYLKLTREIMDIVKNG